MLFKRLISLLLVLTALLQLFPIIFVPTVAEEALPDGNVDASADLSVEEVISVDGITFVEEAPEYDSAAIAEVLTIEDGFTYEVLNGTYAGITGYVGESAELVIPSEVGGYIVQQISAGAFEYNSVIETVTFPSTLERIEADAFYEATALKNINFSESVTAIGRDAFAGCTALTSVAFPPSVKSIGQDAFAYCSALESISYPVGWESVPGYSTPFADCPKLTSITIPEGVTSIPAYAFELMSSLESIELPESLTSIGMSAFAYCGKLKSIDLPDGITRIESTTFIGCKGLSSIDLHEGIVFIGEDAFNDCDGLTHVDFPESLTTLYRDAFSYCDNLESISYPINWNSVGRYSTPFAKCPKLTSITIPEGVTSIPAYAFEMMTSLESIELPESLTSIGMSAFAYCGKLKSIDLPDGITRIESTTFIGCKGLSSIELHEGIVFIGEDAFNDCDGLTHVDFPDSLTILCRDAFAYCENLESISYPVNWESVSGYSTPFAKCPKLTDIIIPEGVTSIPAYAFGFADCVEFVSIPEGVTEIKAGTFEYCDALAQIYIPNSVSFIDESAFEYCPNVTFYCNKNSMAGVFAIKYGIPLVNIGGPSVSAKYLSSSSVYDVNMEGVSASGYFPMVCKYAFNKDVSVEGVSLTFSVPNNAELIESSVTLDGVLCIGYTYEDDVLTIPVEKLSGTVRFYLKPLSYDLVTTYGYANFYNGSSNVTELINVVYAEQPLLTCTSLKETALSKFTVSGVTYPGNTVDIYLDGAFVKTVEANKAGDYSIDIVPSLLVDGKKYTVVAKAQSRSGEELTASTSIVYRYGTPALTAFVMEHNGQTIDMLNLGTVKPIVTFRGVEPFKFTVKFDTPRNVKNVFIVSNRGNVKKVMAAEWDEKAQAFVAEGLFDADDPNYVPGTISVEYARNNGHRSFAGVYDFKSDAALESIPEKWRDASVTIEEEGGSVIKASILPTISGNTIKVSGSVINLTEDFDADYAAKNGYTRVVDDDGNVGFARYYEDPGGTFHYDVYDPIKGELISYGIDAISKELSTVYGFYDTIWDGVTRDIEYQQMLNDIEWSNLTPTQKKALREDVENAMVFNEVATVIKLVGSAAETLFPLSPTVKITVTVVETVLDILQEYTKYSLFKRMFGLQSFGKGFRWAIDPSGYVYDKETEVRIQGVKATLYYRPTMEDDPIIWDAGEYSQLNPLYTDADGRYAWDVPEGYWQVMYEHEDYETAYSEWLLVPPPQTDVNIAMTPLPKLIGDVNGDKVVNSDDAVAILRYLAGYDSTGYDIANGDYNGDTVTNSDDAVAILRMLAGYVD